MEDTLLHVFGNMEAEFKEKLYAVCMQSRELRWSGNVNPEGRFVSSQMQ